MMKMKRALDILKEVNNPHFKIQRDRKCRVNFSKILDILDNPQESFRSIHVTGTNGKGSVAHKTSCALQKAGFKVGLYTSPHLFSLRERISINQQMISQEEIGQNIINIHQIAQRENIPLTFFEYLTAAGFLHFRHHRCDFVSVEVGLGGRNDSTTIINPDVSVITSIGLDHTEVLGPKVENIAWEKAGIIKSQKSVVLGPSAQLKIITDYAETLNAPIKKVQKKAFQHFEQQNKQISLVTLQTLKQEYKMNKLTDKAIQQGIKSRLPCRMQLLEDKHLPAGCKGKQVYFDVGHNPQAITNAIKFLQATTKVGKEKIKVVFGSSRKKIVDESLTLLEQSCGHIYLVQAHHERAMPINLLQQHIGLAKKPQVYRMFDNGNIATTLLYAVADPQSEIILICGSFFIMKQAKAYFIKQPPSELDESISQLSQLQQQINDI